MSNIMREDWIEVELGEVCLSSKGKKPPILENKISEIVNVPYINIKAFEKGIIDEYTDGNKCNLCEDGDLLMVWDGARAGLSGKARKGAVGSTLMKIEEVKGIEKQYLSYFLLSLYTKINTNPRGVGIPHVEPRILWHSKLLIVSRPIQRAIVAKIEALFSDLDNGIANFKTAQAQLKIYRQAVLKKAFEGSLTSSITNEENQCTDNLPKGWRWVTLGEVIEKIEAGKSFRCDERPPINDEVGVLKVSAVSWEEFSELESKTIISDDKVNQSYIVKQGDFLFSRANTLELVGRSVIVNNIHKNIMLSDKTLRFKFLEFINPFYILYFLRTKSGRKQIENLSTGNQISMRNIGQNRIKQITFPLCSLAEQTQIVQEIESRLSVCDKVEQSISESLAKAEALRQSILKKAFEGKLLSQAEIEQCKKEADYEPASELLARIERSRNEKIKADASTRSTRGKLAKEQEKKKVTTNMKSEK